MTSDAKIGLLLGLVFIFVIAFIINGLPSLKPQTSKGELPTNMVPLHDENFGVADTAQKAQEVFDWSPLIDSQEDQGDGPVEVAAVEPSQGSVAASAEAQPQVANAPEVRSTIPLPPIEALLQQLVRGMEGQEQQAVVSMDVPQPAIAQPVAPAVQTQAKQDPKPAKPATTTPAPKIYVVGDGESLASVAKKAYGPEEGNKLVNVQRIYEANRDILKSPDEVKVGQKLVIPPLPQPASGPKKPEDVLSAALFKFKSESEAKPASASTPPTSQDGRWYVVQDGDNLWKIAVSQLGSGARYEEIAKLNAELLKNKDSLDVGMRLRLPAK